MEVLISMESLIKGMDITLYARTQTGADAFNRPIYEESPVEVKNVLVSPVSTDGIVDDQQMKGKRQEYELCIPKDDTNVWEDRTVEFFGRKWRTFGFIQEWIPENVPLDWNRKIRVKRYG